MKRVLMVCAVCAVCLLPGLSRADCESSTKACDDQKANASRCNTQWGFRAEVMCETQNKAAEAVCSQANRDCGGGSSTTTTTGRGRNQ